MAWYDPRNIVAFHKRNNVPIVVEGKINPSLLAIAQRAYWVQSRVLRIPDRFGPFSSGPPLLQAHQANKLAAIVTEVAIPLVGATIMEWVLETRWWLPIFMGVMSLLFAISVYVQEIFFNPMRGPDYNWTALHEKMGVVQPAS